MREDAFNPRDLLEADLAVESVGVLVRLRNLPKYPFNTQLVERIVKGDEEHVAVDPVRVPTCTMHGDRLAGVVLENYSAETPPVLVPADRDVGLRMERGAGEQRNLFPILGVIKFDVVLPPLVESSA